MLRTQGLVILVVAASILSACTSGQSPVIPTKPTVSVVSQGKTAPGLSWSPSGTFNFGSVVAGHTSSQTFTLTNSGSRSGMLTTSLSGSADFTITSDTCTGNSLGLNASCSVGVQFAPNANDNVSGTLTATSKKSPSGASVNLIGGASGSTTFSFTSTAQTFVVPAFVTHVTINALGAAGSDSNSTPACAQFHFGRPGGLGAWVIATIPVTPQETLTVRAGGFGDDGNLAGGYNGGQDFGGGASEVSDGSGNDVVVAGGGGAAGCTAQIGIQNDGNGGAGGGGAQDLSFSGGQLFDGNPGNGNGGNDLPGGGGSSTGGMGGGGDCGSACNGGYGSRFLGGLAPSAAGGSGSGGGGGYYGGGGGGWDQNLAPSQGGGGTGGGGGSSFAELTATNVSATAGGNPNNNGQVTISW